MQPTECRCFDKDQITSLSRGRPLQWGPELTPLRIVPRAVAMLAVAYIAAFTASVD